MAGTIAVSVMRYWWMCWRNLGKSSRFIMQVGVPSRSGNV